MTCIPQPGTANVAGRRSATELMFRAAYRNFIDHESLVVSHSVDPSVGGVVSGVRWYDFRLSGNPDADLPDLSVHLSAGNDRRRRQRPQPLDAVDGHGHGGKHPRGLQRDRQDQRQRQPQHPLHRSSQGGSSGCDDRCPRSTIVTGTANNTGNTRWGDYSSMSVDPFDDCTFWYVSQYYPVDERLVDPDRFGRLCRLGAEPGNARVTTCNARPTFTPTIGSATVPGDNQITVTWTAVAPTPGAYAIERADGVCGSEGLFRPLAATAGTATSFTDTNVIGAVTVIPTACASPRDAAGKCQAQLASVCVSATATGSCNLKPTFAGATDATEQPGRQLRRHDQLGRRRSSRCPLDAEPALQHLPRDGTRLRPVGREPDRHLCCRPELVSRHRQPRERHDLLLRGSRGGQQHRSTAASAAAATRSRTVVVVAGNAVRGRHAGRPGHLDRRRRRRHHASSASTSSAAGDTLRSGVALRQDGRRSRRQPHTRRRLRLPQCGPCRRRHLHGRGRLRELQAPPLTVGATSVNLQYWERHQIEYHSDTDRRLSTPSTAARGPDVPAPSDSISRGLRARRTTPPDWEPLSCSPTPPRNGLRLYRHEDSASAARSKAAHRATTGS